MKRLDIYETAASAKTLKLFNSCTIYAPTPAEEHRATRGEGVEQQAQQHPRRGPATPGGAVEDAVVVHEPRLRREPGDPQDARHRAPARRQDGPDQQHLGMPPAPLAEERREG